MRLLGYGLSGMHVIHRSSIRDGTVGIAEDEEDFIFQDSDSHGLRTTITEPIVLDPANRLAA